MRRIGVFIAVLGLAAATPQAKDFWERPHSGWKHSEVLKMLEDSPWSRKVVLTDQRAGRGTTNVAGEMELYHSYTVRLFTALPVRQAYVRMFQLMNQYDEMSRRDKEEFDGNFAFALRDFPDEVIVNLDFETNDRQTAMEVDRRLKQSTAAQLKQSAYLISDRLGRVELINYFPPAPDGTGAKFVYPRVVDGQPVVSPEDREVKFELWVPGTGHKVYQVWRVANLMLNGEPAF
jgi:hypothetical protein